jgi:hypothetical protein
VEMDAALLGDWKVVEEEVHQHALARAHLRPRHTTPHHTDRGRKRVG